MPFEHVTKISGLSSWFLFVFKASIDGYTTGMQADGGAFRGTLCIVGCGFSWQHWPQLLITYGNRNISFSTTRQSDHSKDILRDLIICVTWAFKKFLYIYCFMDPNSYLHYMHVFPEDGVGNMASIGSSRNLHLRATSQFDHYETPPPTAASKGDPCTYSEFSSKA